MMVSVNTSTQFLEQMEDFLNDFGSEVPSKPVKRPLSSPTTSQPKKISAPSSIGSVAKVDQAPSFTAPVSKPALQNKPVSNFPKENASVQDLPSSSNEVRSDSAPSPPSPRNLLKEFEAQDDLDDEEALRLLEAADDAEISENELSQLLAQADPDLDHLQSSEPSLPSAALSQEVEESLLSTLQAIDQAPIDPIISSEPQGTEPVAGSSILLDIDGVPTLRFFCLDLFEDPTAAPGSLFLFGRVPVGNRFDSVCVCIPDVLHHLYVLPAIAPSGERYPPADVIQELQKQIQPLLKSSQERVGFRVESKRYAFGLPDIPAEVRAGREFH